MAQDADHIIVGQYGEVWKAPVGTAAPVDTDTAMATVNAAWKELGFISEEGVTFTPTLQGFSVPAWQAEGRPVRRGVASREESLSFTMLEWNKQTLPLAFGGGEFTEIGTSDVFKFAPPTGAEEDEYAFVVHFEDGGDAYRLVIPRAAVTDLAEFQLVRTEATGLDVTLGVINTGTTDPWYMITENTVWDPAA